MKKIFWKASVHLLLISIIAFIPLSLILQKPVSAQTEVGSKNSIGIAALKEDAGSKRLIIKYKENASSTAKSDTLKKFRAQKENSLSSTLDIVKLPAELNTSEEVEKIKADPNVEFVEIDKLVPVSANEIIPNDPKFTSQYYLRKTSTSTAWNIGKATNVKLAVCDTGIEPTHSDLWPNLLTNLGYNTVDNSPNWTPVHPHGTMVAGIIAGVANNNTGIAGVAWDAKIIPVRISNLEDGAAYLSDAAECIVYAAEKGARAINLSYAMADSAAINEAAKIALSKGAITIIAAGNEGSEQSHIDYNTFLTVSATDENDQIAGFSSYGKFIDIAAPGTNISTTYTGNDYTQTGGTSFSAPIVTGIIGIMRAKNPSATAAFLKKSLLGSVDDIGIAGHDKYFGAGRINACKAIYAATGATPDCPTITPPAAQSTCFDFKDQKGTIYKDYLVYKFPVGTTLKLIPTYIKSGTTNWIYWFLSGPYTPFVNLYNSAGVASNDFIEPYPSTKPVTVYAKALAPNVQISTRVNLTSGASCKSVFRMSIY